MSQRDGIVSVGSGQGTGLVYKYLDKRFWRAKSRRMMRPMFHSVSYVMFESAFGTNAAYF